MCKDGSCLGFLGVGKAATSWGGKIFRYSEVTQVAWPYFEVIIYLWAQTFAFPFALSHSFP